MVERLSREWLLRGGHFPLLVSWAYLRKPCPPHTHDFFELQVVTAGTGAHIIDGQRIRVSRADLFLLPPGPVHSFEASDDLEIANVWFLPDALGLPTEYLIRIPNLGPAFRPFDDPHSCTAPEVLQLHVDDSCISIVGVMLSELEVERLRQAPGYESASIAALMRLLVYLGRMSQAGRTHASSIHRFKSILDAMSREYGSAPHLSDFARMAGMSVAGFSRAFRAATGETPMQHMLHIRVGRAKQLLADGRLSVTDVAFRVGFSDSNYFCRCFKKIVGISPGQYSRLL